MPDNVRESDIDMPHTHAAPEDIAPTAAEPHPDLGSEEPEPHDAATHADEPGHPAPPPEAEASDHTPQAEHEVAEHEEESDETAEEEAEPDGTEELAGADEGEEQPAAAAAEAAPPSNKHWYVVKVQTGREESIRDAIERRVKIEGLEEFYGQIVIPVERVTEMRNSKRVTKERKLYPGYLMVEVEYNDRILYLFRETSGVGDFVGATINRPPPPMSDREVERMIGASKVSAEDPTKVVHAKPKFGKGDRVKVTDGTFAGMTGEVKELHEAEATVSVELRIFDRPVDVKMEYWQVELA